MDDYFRSLDIVGLTNADGTRAIQYAILNEGKTAIYGDQNWVKDGVAAKWFGGETIHREITITYGPWKKEGQ